MNQGKSSVAKQDMAIIGISEIKWMGMGIFNLDDHYIYYWGRRWRSSTQSAKKKKKKKKKIRKKKKKKKNKERKEKTQS